MTTAPSSTSLERSVRQEPVTRTACLRLCWSVAPVALERLGRTPLKLELELRSDEPARVTLDGVECEPAAAWARAWDGSLVIRRMGSGEGKGLMIVEAAPLVVAVIGTGSAERPLHVACELPEVLGLAGGRYEFVGGGVSA